MMVVFNHYFQLGGGGAGQLDGNFGTSVRASFFKPTPIIYLVFEKNDLIEQNVYTFIYCSLIFIYSVIKITILFSGLNI